MTVMNAGASDLAKAAIGSTARSAKATTRRTITRLFSPEFRNRLDAIIPFANLSPDVISKVVEKFVFQLEAQLGDRNITIELTPEANQWLAERGYDEKFGARPLARVIQEHIKKPLAEEILFGALKDGGIVRVLVQEKDGQKELGFEYLKPDGCGSSHAGLTVLARRISTPTIFLVLRVSGGDTEGPKGRRRRRGSALRGAPVHRPGARRGTGLSPCPGAARLALYFVAATI